MIRPLVAVGFTWLIGMSFVATCLGQSPGNTGVSERAVKAAYLYKFASYVDWPGSLGADSNGPLQIGILGAPGLANELATISRDHRVRGRSILVRQLDTVDSLDDLQILFVGNDESGRLDSLLAPAKTRPILTVTESNDALDAGSIINFVVKNERVRFEISLDEAEQSGLRLDSRLLAVAQNVRRPPR